jgi:GTP-binding protein Era
VKSAIVAVVGRPSAGKSSLVNRACGFKVAIVSPLPQTTRNRVKGIMNSPGVQIVFVDTPGYHASTKKLNTYLMDLVSSTVSEADSVLYVVDGARAFGLEERALIVSLARCGKPLVIALNKADIRSAGRGDCRRELEAAFPKAPLLEVSARTGSGMEGLVQALVEAAPEGDLLYPEDYYTDQTPEFRISEIVREKAIGLTREEVPHALYVRMEDLEMRDGGKTLWARGFLVVERESQKGILVGKAGGVIKKIVSSAQAELAEIFPYAVRLDIRVKVDKDWRKKDVLLKKLIR